MTKILLQNDRIIFDGHADSIQECETITLLCDSLVNSPNFKTVKHESGYAEFEKVGKAKELKFVPAPATITMNFDSHITAVNSRSPMTVSWTTSGETKTTYAQDGTTYTFDVVLASGYVIDTVTLSESDEQLGKLTGKTDTTFSILAGSGGITQTITITSKQATMSKSYDLSTSSKWSALSDGEHTVQIIAKGTGYRDSAKSTSVTVTKGGSTGETWVLNYQMEPGSQSYNFTGISFTSNNQNFDRLYYNRQASDVAALSYFLNGTEKQVYSFNDYSDIWLDGEEYRTITFDSPVTDASLLAWLQANATKQGGATLINFTIGSTSYQAEEGMTWQQWVDSSYNTSNGVFFISDGYLKWTNGSVYGPTATSSSANPKATDTPQANGVYTAKAGGGGSQ